MTESASRCTGQEDMGHALVAYAYDECEPDERCRVEAHLADCSACVTQLASLRGARRALGEWTVPELQSQVRIVPAVTPVRPLWRGVVGPRWGLAAAAVLLLAAAVTMVGVEFQSGPDGFMLRVGPPGEDAARDARSVSETLASRDDRFLGPTGAAGGPAVVESRALDSAVLGEAEVMRRLQALIAQSELRQRQELAMWFTEFAHEFNMQRLADQEQMRQEIGALEGYADYLVRVGGK